MIGASVPEFNHRLSEYEGGTGRLWDFSPTHDRLVVELSARDGRRGYLVLLGCMEIRAPTLWSLRSPTVCAVDESFVFEDAGVRFAFAYEFQLEASYIRG